MKTKEKISLLLLTSLYLLMTISFVPGSVVGTLNATLGHLMVTLPYTIGLTIIAVSLVQKIVGQKLLPDRIARIYLTIGLLAEFFYAIYHYAEQGQI